MNKKFIFQFILQIEDNALRLKLLENIINFIPSKNS
jgi:hypothetical protein